MVRKVISKKNRERLTKEFIDELDVRKKILGQASQCLEFSEYLITPKNDSQKEIMKSPSSLLKFNSHCLWRVAAVELSKLLSTNDCTNKYNIHKFLRKFRKSGHYGIHALKNEQIDNWQNFLDPDSAIPKKIMYLRNKIYAHTENAPDADAPTYDETREVIKTILEVFRTTASSFGVDFSDNFLELYFKKDSCKWLEILADYNESKTQEAFDRFSKGKLPF